MIRWLRNFPMLQRTLVIVIVSVVGVLAVFAYLGSDALDNSTIRITEMNQEYASLAATTVDSRLDGVLGVLAVQASSLDFVYADSQTRETALRGVLESQPFIRAVVLWDTSGKVMGSEPRLSETEIYAAQQSYMVQQAIQTGQNQISGFSYSDPESPRVAFLVAVRGKDGTVEGWLGASIDFRLLFFPELLNLTNKQASGRFILLDSEGNTLEAFGDGTVSMRHLSYADRLLPLLQSRSSASLPPAEIEEDGHRKTVVVDFAPLTSAKWGVVIEQPEESVYALLYTLRWQFVIFGAVVLTIAILGAWMQEETISGPIRELVKATRRLIAGDLETPIRVVGRDETAELANEFDAMRRRLLDWSGALSAAVERQTHKLSTLYAIDRVASKTLELDEVLTVSLDLILNVTKMDAGGYFLMEDDGTLSLRVQHGLPEDLARAMERCGPGTGLAWSATKGKCVLVNPPIESEEEETARQLQAADFHALAAAPLIAKDNALGALALFARKERTFAEEDIDLLESIGQQLGSAVHNAQLYKSEQRRREEAERLYDAARAVGASLGLREVCERILQELQRVVPYDCASVQWMEGERLTVIGSYGCAGTEKNIGDVIQAANDTPTQEVFEKRQPVIVDDIWESEASFRPEGGRGYGMRAWLGVPMQYGERVIGLIVLEKREKAFYTREYARMASAFAAQAAVAVENARLFAQVEENLTRISNLYELGAEVISASVPQEAARAVVLRVVQAARGHSAVVTLIDASGHVTLRVSADMHGLLPTEPPPRPNGGTMRVFHGGETLTIPEPDAELVLITPRLFAAGVRALIGLPLRAAERIIGVLSVRYDTPHSFAPEEVRALTTFANTAATALERARLLEETERRLEEVGALYDLSSVLRGKMTLQEMLPLILQKAVKMAHADAANISLVEGEEVVCRAVEGFPEEIVGRRVPLGEGIVGSVAASGEMRHTPFLPSDPLVMPSTRSVAVVRGVGSTLCLPLRMADKVVGAMLMLSYGGSQYGEEDVHLLNAAADIAGGSIHRAILFEQLEHRVHELAALYEFGKAVSTSLRLEDVIRLVLEAGPPAVRAEAGCIFLWDDVDESLILWEPSEKTQRLPGKVKYRAGEGLVGWVFLEGRPAMVPDVMQDPRWKSEPEKEAPIIHRAKDVLAVPIFRGRKVLGVLMAVNRQRRGTFTESDQSLLTALAGQTAIAIENAMLFEDVRDLSVDAISSLAKAIDARDPYTRGHSEEVTRIVVDLAREIGWQGSDLEMIEFAALLHDVGKIAVPDDILRKPNVLIPEEWNVIYLHPYHSAQIVRPVEPLRRIIPWIYHHHERWDGTGYPDGLRGEAIPEGARIIAIVDSFNAITTDRPYHKAISEELALQEIERCAGSQFDPNIAKIFLKMMRKQAPV